MDGPLVKCVSAFTRGPYALEAEQLERSASRITMPLETYEYGPFESWHHAVAAKPDFIAQRLAALGPQFDGLLWVDADARFLRDPDWEILANADIACTHFQWSKGHQLELLTGTFYIRRDPRMIEFAKEWAYITQPFRHMDTPEQFGLQTILKKPEWSWVKVLDLPIEWTFIDPEAYGMYPKAKPCIIHTQASRRLRK